MFFKICQTVNPFHLGTPKCFLTHPKNPDPAKSSRIDGFNPTPQILRVMLQLEDLFFNLATAYGTIELRALYMGSHDTWRIIPFGTWLITMVSESPK